MTAVRRRRSVAALVGLCVFVSVLGPVAAGAATGPCAGKRGAARAKCLRRTTTTTTTPRKGPGSGSGSGSGTAPARGQSFPGTGSFAVGTDIRPGLYRSAGDPADPKAGTDYRPYFERTTASGEIIDNGRPWWEGVAWTEILPTDARFETQRFLPWEPVDPARDKGLRATRFQSWETCVLVGFDVVPGTYRATVDEGDTALAEVFLRATFDADDLESFGFVADGDEWVLPAGRFFCAEGVDEWVRVGS